MVKVGFNLVYHQKLLLITYPFVKVIRLHCKDDFCIIILLMTCYLINSMIYNKRICHLLNISTLYKRCYSSPLLLCISTISLWQYTRTNGLATLQPLYFILLEGSCKWGECLVISLWWRKGCCSRPLLHTFHQTFLPQSITELQDEKVIDYNIWSTTRGSILKINELHCYNRQCGKLDCLFYKSEIKSHFIKCY